jgi:large subunit ribosomal protein L24
MKIRLKDKVKIISGKDKGKVSEVTAVFPEISKVIVSGVNIVKKHVKGEKGGIITMEKPIHVSNVMYYDEIPSKIGFTLIDGKKFRVMKKSGKVVK